MEKGSGEKTKIILIEAGASVRASANSGYTVIAVAVDLSERECAKLLRAAGATD